MSIAELKQTMLKMAAGELGNNEGMSTHTAPFKVHPDPADRPSGNIDAPWGEPGPPDPAHNSEGVYAEWKKDHDQLLGRVFTGMDAAAKADKSVISKHFSEKHESHSALLNHKTAQAAPQTLTEKVWSTFGRR